jgi:hypothetical protein
VAERFDGPVDIDGSLADPGLLRVNGPAWLGPGGKGEGVVEKLKKVEHVGQGEIECGHILAHGDGRNPAANFGSHVGVEGNIDVKRDTNVGGDINVTGDITVGGDVHVQGDVISDKLAEIERRIHDLHNWVQLPDGRSVVNAVQDLGDRVKQLEHDAKPWYKGGRIFG